MTVGVALCRSSGDGEAWGKAARSIGLTAAGHAPLRLMPCGRVLRSLTICDLDQRVAGINECQGLLEGRT